MQSGRQVAATASAIEVACAELERGATPEVGELPASIVTVCMDVHTKLDVMMVGATACLGDPSKFILFGLEEVKNMATEATAALTTLEPFVEKLSTV